MWFSLDICDLLLFKHSNNTFFSRNILKKQILVYWNEIKYGLSWWTGKVSASKSFHFTWVLEYRV